jgi:hypothetical protein
MPDLGAPVPETSIADVLKERDEAGRKNAANAAARSKADAARRILEARQAELNRLQKMVAEAEQQVDAAFDAADKAGLAAVDLVDDDLAQFDAQLQQADATTKRNAQAKERARLIAERDESDAAAKALTDQIEKIDEWKRDQIAAAAMPISGLSFSADGGVTFAGVPFEQASHAERLRASVAIGFAMNPRLRVLLVRDASLLDEDGLRLVAEMAEQAGAQVWLERVERDAQTTVLIEDGQVVAAVAP